MNFPGPYLALCTHYICDNEECARGAASRPELALRAMQTPEMTIGGSPILPEDDVGLYGRSVTFVPESPSLPANFR